MQSLEHGLEFSLGSVARADSPLAAVNRFGLVERMDAHSSSLIGRLVTMSGTHGSIDCMLDPNGEDWSIGHLITIDGRNTRLVGVICEISTVRQKWSEGEPNAARATFELHGEIIEGLSDRPTFRRGVRAYPSLGAIVRRIRIDDLRAIYSFRGRKGVEIGQLSQNSEIPAEISIDQLVARNFAVLGTTGVGKTTTVSMLIARAIAARPNLRVMILDPHNEYEDHFADQACVVDSENLELPAWMFRFDELSNVIFGNRAPQPDERDALYEVIQCSKTIYFAHHSVSTTGMTLTLLRQPTVESSGDNAGYAYSVYGERRYCNYR